MTTTTRTLPDPAEIAELLESLKPYIDDDFRAYDDYDDDDPPSMLVTIGWDGSNWAHQTGDTSYWGPCYGMPHWADVALERDTDTAAAAADIVRDLDNQEF